MFKGPPTPTNALELDFRRTIDMDYRIWDTLFRIPVLDPIDKQASLWTYGIVVVDVAKFCNQGKVGRYERVFGRKSAFNIGNLVVYEAFLTLECILFRVSSLQLDIRIPSHVFIDNVISMVRKCRGDCRFPNSQRTSNFNSHFSYH